MSIKVMIIDGQPEFRSLLMHHVTTHWPDAIISAYDPTTAGYLPEEFSGAGNDLIMLGNQLGDRSGLDVLEQFMRVRRFPPTVFFGGPGDERAALEAGAGAIFDREAVRHDVLISQLREMLVERHHVASTRSLFVGDERAGINPLIRGYRLIDELSMSAHSAVYLAERESLGQSLVLKVLRQIPDADDAAGAFDRFLQEYELIADLDHPNIVRIFDLGVGDSHAHIAMEYLGGGDLKRRIEEGIDDAQAVAYFSQIASALAEIHTVGILHRDLKPANVMLRDDDSIALIDFGLAKRMRLQMEITGGGEIFGTPYYMSPEQGHGDDIDSRSDIYSLGVIFYEMLTGEKPFAADSAMGIIFKHAKAPIPRLPPRHARHQSLLEGLLAKDPRDRIQTAADVLKWL